jgi:hypothetical protein
MNIREKCILFIATFCALYIGFYLEVSLSIFPDGPLDQLANVSQNGSFNFLIVMIACLIGAFILLELIILCYAKLIKLRKKIFVPKLGEVMVSRGYVTKEQLKEALSEQRLRLGEVLIKAGLITTEQLEHALDYQKVEKKKLGEILRELGYSTDEKIIWALRKMNRRLGEIFVEKGFYTKIEINRVLARMRYKRVI